MGPHQPGAEVPHPCGGSSARPEKYRVVRRCSATVVFRGVGSGVGSLYGLDSDIIVCVASLIVFPLFSPCFRSLLW